MCAGIRSTFDAVDVGDVAGIRDSAVEFNANILGGDAFLWRNIRVFQLCEKIGVTIKSLDHLSSSGGRSKYTLKGDGTGPLIANEERRPFARWEVDY